MHSPLAKGKISLLAATTGFWPWFRPAMPRREKTGRNRPRFAALQKDQNSLAGVPNDTLVPFAVWRFGRCTPSLVTSMPCGAYQTTGKLVANKQGGTLVLNPLPTPGWSLVEGKEKKPYQSSSSWCFVVVGSEQPKLPRACCMCRWQSRSCRCGRTGPRAQGLNLGGGPKTETLEEPLFGIRN